MSATIVRDVWEEFVRAGKLGDDPDERDEAFWDEVERRLGTVEEAFHWREVLHPRDRRGQFRDVPGKPSPVVETIGEEREQAIDRIEAAIDRDGEPALVAFSMQAVAGALGALGFELADAHERNGGQITSWIHGPTGGVLHLESHDQMVSSSAWDPNRVEAKRAEGPLKSFEEMRADTIALARELAERHGAETKLRGFGVDEELSDTAGLHNWNGDASIGPDAPDTVEMVGALREKGQELPDVVIAPYWFANQVAAHEISHSVNPILFSTYHANVGRALEEALTEEASHLLAADRMRRRGEIDVLAWYRDNRAHPYANGTYHAERLALMRIFDRMKIAPEHRREFIMELKFEIPPEDRIDVLGEGLLAAGLTEEDAVDLLRRLDIEHPFNRTREAEERLGPFNVVADLEGLPESEPTRIGFGKNVYEVGQEIDVEGYGRSRVRDGNDHTLLVQTPEGLLRLHASEETAIVRTYPPRTLGDGEEAIAVGDAVEYQRPDGGWTRGRLVRVHRSAWEDYLAEVRVGDQTVLISPTSTGTVRKVANATTMPPR